MKVIFEGFYFTICLQKVLFDVGQKNKENNKNFPFYSTVISPRIGVCSNSMMRCLG